MFQKLYLKTLSDIDLADKFINGDKSAFEIIYERNYELVFRFIYSRCGQKEKSQDITSETFLSLIELIKKYNKSSKLSSFIIGIAFIKLKNSYRHEKYFFNSENFEFIDLSEINQEESEGKSSKIKDLHSFIRKLKPNYQKVIKLRFLENKSINDVAKELNLTSANIRVIQNRAIKKLKIYFKNGNKRIN
jgi:RNA polymerase sigma-70 factor (ECF subfamily)